MPLNMLLSQPPQQTNSSRGSIEVGQLVLSGDFPVTRGGGVYGSRLEDDGGDAVCQRAVDDVSVAGDPSDVGHAGELVLGVNIEDELDGKSSAEEVATGGVQNTLGLASRAGGLDVIN
jgi:hypothetical protein